MLTRHDKIIIGVSGGPDSMALLYVLNALKKEFDLSLVIAHLNHMIRKGDAERDARFVKRCAEKLKLPVVIESEDITKIAKESKASVEEAARMVRYDFYQRAARQFEADKIALGHTADDQAETVLMRMIRGSGLLGLSGIPPVRNLKRQAIIRPLIDVSKDEIKKFLKQGKISFRKDITNTQSIYFRNKIRQQLIPFLKREFNPEIKKILKETGKNLRVDYDYLLKCAKARFKKYGSCTAKRIKIDTAFLNEDIAIQRMIIREAIKMIKGNLNSITYGHWEDLNRMLKKSEGWSLDLPGGVVVRRMKDSLVFLKGRTEINNNSTAVRYSLKIPGRTKILEVNKTIKADFVKKPKELKFKKFQNKEYFDFEKLKLPLSIRFKKSKDRIKPLGMQRHKRLKQLFIDEKIPAEKRRSMPLAISGNKIIWVCGVKRSDYAKITDETKRILNLKIE